MDIERIVNADLLEPSGIRFPGVLFDSFREGLSMSILFFRYAKGGYMFVVDFVVVVRSVVVFV